MLIFGQKFELSPYVDYFVTTPSCLPSVTVKAARPYGRVFAAPPGDTDSAIATGSDVSRSMADKHDRQGYLRMSQQRDLPESMAWRVIGRLESGQTQRSVADAVGVARSVVARLWNRFQETENVRRRPGAGRPRATTSTDDRYTQLTTRRNRTENATQLQRQLLSATGRRVFSQRVRIGFMREGSMHVGQ
ncbi:HTH_Tnp_Tc3_2 domain-containing protein [Trichonephila clavipes]|nr:HTH_Tnp_Tc3_2 domain-containing protein [Trichonephila clavipes]